MYAFATDMSESPKINVSTGTNKDIKNVSFHSTFVRRAHKEAEVEEKFLEIVDNR